MKKFLTALVAVSVLLPSLAFASVGISLVGGAVRAPQGQSYQEPGYSAFSTVDGDVTGSVVVSSPGTSQPGLFSINYDVTDSALDSASAARSLTVISGGSGQIYCSGPTAPGYNVSLPGGGCGGTSNFYFYQAPLPNGTQCAFFSGCMWKQ